MFCTLIPGELAWVVVRSRYFPKMRESKHFRDFLGEGLWFKRNEKVMTAPEATD